MPQPNVSAPPSFKLEKAQLVLLVNETAMRSWRHLFANFGVGYQNLVCGAKKFGVIILSLAKTPLLDITTTFNYVSLTFYFYFFVTNYPFAIMSTTALSSTNHFLPLFDFSNVTIVTIVT